VPSPAAHPPAAAALSPPPPPAAGSEPPPKEVLQLIHREAELARLRRRRQSLTAGATAVCLSVRPSVRPPACLGACLSMGGLVDATCGADPFAIAIVVGDLGSDNDRSSHASAFPAWLSYHGHCCAPCTSVLRRCFSQDHNGPVTLTFRFQDGFTKAVRRPVYVDMLL
jgi:hypothetical protein